jgi:hypothetical protein
MFIKRLESNFRAFIDFFTLFSGVSTASALARTQGRPILTRGMFLFRGGKMTSAAGSPMRK